MTTTVKDARINLHGEVLSIDIKPTWSGEDYAQITLSQEGDPITVYAFDPEIVAELELKQAGEKIFLTGAYVQREVSTNGEERLTREIFTALGLGFANAAPTVQPTYDLPDAA